MNREILDACEERGEGEVSEQVAGDRGWNRSKLTVSRLVPPGRWVGSQGPPDSYHEGVSSIPITDAQDLTVADKLRLAVDLAEAGLDVMRARLQREDAEADAEEIERRLVAWLRERPGAEHGDAEGRPAPHRFSGR